MSKTEVGAIVSQYAANQAVYSSPFKNSELYRAYSVLQEEITGSQRAESEWDFRLTSHQNSLSQASTYVE